MTRPPGMPDWAMPSNPLLIHTDPPSGTAILQGQPDGSMVVLPLSFFGYPTGDDAGPWNAAALQLQERGLNGGLLRLGPWDYNLYSPAELGISQILRGHGQQTRVFQQFTGGPAVYQHDPNGGGGGFGSYQIMAGGIEHLVIDGTNAGVGSAGYDFGDGSGITTRGLQIQNYPAGSIGLHGINRFFWTEKAHIDARCIDNGQNCVLENVSGAGIQNSFEFCDFDIYVNALSGGGGQDGFVLQGGSYMAKCQLRLKGNFNTSPNAMTSAVIRITGSDPRTGFISHITHSHFVVGVETDNGNANTPTTIIFGTPSGGSANSMTENWGGLDFDPVTGATFTPSNATAASFNSFGGPVIGDATLAGLNSAPTGWP